jgi:predicted Zn-dependent peptidase
VKSEYRKTVLKNGVRAVSLNMPQVRSVSIGVWIDTGSRDEKPEENGISHFIEHLIFKGTKKRSAKEIAVALESVGGTLNAFTGREHTCYYAKVLEEHVEIALDILSDILKNSLFRPADFKREKSVIIEEIMDSEDTPSDLIFDLFMESLWKKHPLGRPIIGTLQSVSKIKRKQVFDYLHRNYTYPRVVIAASGKINHHKLVRVVDRKFKFNTPPAAENPPKENLTPHPTKKVVKRKSAQTHVCLGLPNFPFTHSQKYAALLLSNILGGGMSSRLFQKIREELGLAYNIYSFSDFFDDAGVFGVYLGTNQNNLLSAIKLILKEFQSIKKKRVSKEELEHTAYQLKGGLIFGAESTITQMNRLARHELFFKDYYSLDKTISLIDKAKAKDVLEVANQLLDPDKLCITVLGPVDQKVLSKIDWK